MQSINSWEDWCEVFHRQDVWEEEIHLICSAHGVKVRQIAGTYPGTNAVFFINDDTVLKIYCPFRNNRRDTELRLHTGLLAHDPLYAQIRFYGTSPAAYDYLAFTRLSGVPVREIAGKRLSPKAIGSLAAAIATLQRRTLEHGPDGHPQCLVHYDLTEDHIFVHEDGSLAGIIDFGDAITGHPADEWPALFASGLQGDDASIDAFRDAYRRQADYCRIDDEDVIAALHRHPFRREILDCLADMKSRFAHNIAKGMM